MLFCELLQAWPPPAFGPQSLGFKSLGLKPLGLQSLGFSLSDSIYRLSLSPCGTSSDCDETLLNLSCLLITHWASSIGDNNQGAQRIHIGVGPSHGVPGPLLIHRNVGLLLVVRRLVLEVVLGVVVHCLLVRSSADFG